LSLAACAGDPKILYFWKVSKLFTLKFLTIDGVVFFCGGEGLSPFTSSSSGLTAVVAFGESVLTAAAAEAWAPVV
jgi:hypothetical protein